MYVSIHMLTSLNVVDNEDVKEFMIKAGVDGKPTVFLFTESQIVVEDMLEDINNMLNSGEIPNLFPQVTRLLINIW